MSRLWICGGRRTRSGGASAQGRSSGDIGSIGRRRVWRGNEVPQIANRLGANHKGVFRLQKGPAYFLARNGRFALYDAHSRRLNLCSSAHAVGPRQA